MRSVSVVLFLYFWNFGIQTLEGRHYLLRNLPRDLNVGVCVQKQRHNQIFCVCQVDQVLVKVVIHCSYIRVRLCLTYNPITY